MYFVYEPLHTIAKHNYDSQFKYNIQNQLKVEENADKKVLMDKLDTFQTPSAAWGH